MEFVVIVPVWDTERQHHFTVRSAHDLLRTAGDMVVVFVDNASPCKASRKYLEELAHTYPHRLHLIANDENRGYGGALNQGLVWGYERGAQYFICSNNDIAFLRADWHENLLAPLRSGIKCLVGPRLIPDNLWVYFDGQHHPYLEGWMLAFGRQFLDEVGYFDEIFHPAWVEDVELSWRATRHGYTLVETQAIPVLHAYGQTGYDGRLPFNDLCAANVEKFKAKVRAGNDAWVGPPTFKSL